MIGRIKISGYKSLDNFEINKITPFTVIAGPNGSGKSNFFEALEFFSYLLNYDVQKALKEFGGFNNIHCRKKRKENRTTFLFEIDWPSSNNLLSKYHLKITNLDSIPIIHERYVADGKIVFEREGDVLKKHDKDSDLESLLRLIIKHYDGAKLIFSFGNILESNSHSPIHNVLKSVKKIAIDPSSARNSNKFNSSDDVLSPNGGNLVAVLQRLEKEQPQVAEEIVDIMAGLVPSLSKISVQNNDIDNTINLAFSEIGHKRIFPPHLVSDGTIYLLSLLVAILSVHSGGDGTTLIEEPERGLHPKAIEELCEIFREGASWTTPIFINTHSETVVRSIKIDELVFLSKEKGLTRAYRPSILQPLGIPLDEAWLTNMLNGGLPK